MTSLSRSIDIKTAPERVFRAIVDLPAMGRFSPENTGGQWLQGAVGPALGVRFKGTNANGTRKWTTTATIVEFEPPSSFVFEVTVGPAKVARWSYCVEPIAGGCRVTESWTDRRNVLAKWIGGKSSGRVDRTEFTDRSIETTLANLKRALEGHR